MELRAELMPTKPEPRRVADLAALANDIVAHLDSGRPYDALVAQFNQLTGENLTIADFEGMAGSMDAEEFVAGILIPYPKIFDQISDDEYIEIIRRIVEYEIPDDESYYWQTLLEINLGTPTLYELLDGEQELTPTQILAEARQKRPIPL